MPHSDLFTLVPKGFFYRKNCKTPIFIFSANSNRSPCLAGFSSILGTKQKQAQCKQHNF